MQIAQGYTRRPKRIYATKKCGFLYFVITLGYPFCTNFLQTFLMKKCTFLAILLFCVDFQNMSLLSVPWFNAFWVFNNAERSGHNYSNGISSYLQKPTIISVCSKCRVTQYHRFHMNSHESAQIWFLNRITMKLLDPIKMVGDCFNLFDPINFFNPKKNEFSRFLKKSWLVFTCWSCKHR